MAEIQMCYTKKLLQINLRAYNHSAYILLLFSVSAVTITATESIRNELVHGMPVMLLTISSRMGATLSQDLFPAPVFGAWYHQSGPRSSRSLVH